MGKFKKGVSANPKGRPKGSKNEITLLKLVAEQAARERNGTKIQQVIDKVVDDALAGNENMMKLVWQSVVSKGTTDDKAVGKEKIQIEINAPKQEVITVIDAEPVTVEEIENEEPQPDER